MFASFLRSFSGTSNEDPDAANPNADGDSSTGKKTIPGVPDIEYDSPMIVKNTFIDTGKAEPESLAPFYEKRTIQSEPPRDLLGSTQSIAEDEEFVPKPGTSANRKLLASTVSIAEADHEEDDDDDEDFVPKPLAARANTALATSAVEEESTPASGSTCAGTSTSPTSSEDQEESQNPAYVSPSRATTDAGLQKGLKLEGLPSQRPAAKVEEFDYPVFVKNTFIDTGNTPPFSIVESMEHRKALSCPEHAIGMPPGLEVQADGTVKKIDEGLLAEAAFKAIAANSDASPGAAGGIAQWPSSIPPPPSAPPVLPPVVSLVAETMPDAPSSLPGNSGYLAGAPQVGVQHLWPVVEPVLGSAEWPTLGSQEHYVGTCKPCAHAYAKGCANGINCIFCHLCPPGELKRRQKEKRAGQRMQRGAT